MADEAHASMDFGGGVGQPEEIVAVDHSRAQRPSPAKAAAQQSMIAPVVLTQEQFSALLAAVVAQRSAAHAAPMKLGNPGPLGLAGFALTTMVLSIFNTGAFLDAKLEPVVLPLALFYGGIVQLIAGVLEIVAGNTFGAVAFASYGAFWMSFAAYVEYVVPDFAAASRNTGDATALFLAVWLVFTLYMAVGAYRVSRALFAVFVVLVPALTCLIIGVSALHSQSLATALSPGATATMLLMALQAAVGGDAGAGWSRAGGWLGMLCAALAWYASAAGVLNPLYGFDMLPVWPTPAPKTDA